MSVTPASGASGAGFTPPDPNATPAAPAAATPAASVVRGGSSGPVRIQHPAAGAHALAEALGNDRRGVVSERDAENIVKDTLAAIATADDPRAVFEGSKRLIKAAKLMLGNDADAAKILDGFEGKAQALVASRLDDLTGAGQLPADAADAFNDLMRYDLSGPVTFSDVQRRAEGGFTFNFTDGQTASTGFAIRRDGDWFFAPKPITEAQLTQVREGFQSYFDEHWVETLKDDWGNTDAEIADMRDAIGVRGALFPGIDSDPYNYVDDYALAFRLDNPTGSDHGFFAGFDPATGEVDAYDFN